MQKDEQSNQQSNLGQTLSSGPMMREVMRWNNTKQAQIVRPRWNEWARTLIERHQLITARRWPQTMTFTRPATVVETRERLMNFSLNIYSKMNLAIQPILREMHFREEKIARSQSARNNNSRAISNSDSFKSQPPSSITVNQVTQFQPVKFVERKSDNKSSAMLAAESQITTSRAASYSNNDIEELPRGLSLVFRRLHQMDEITRTHHRSKSIYESAGRYALSLVKRSQRIEQSVSSGAVTVIRQPSPAKTQQVAPQIVMSEPVAQHAPGMFRAQQVRTDNARQMPEQMVEQLTEHVIRQIDQRAIAWRERMGKI